MTATAGAPAGAVGRVVAVLQRVVPFAAAVQRGVGRLALVSLAAAAVLVYALLRHGLGSGSETGVRALGTVLALAPPVILLVFWFALRELLEVPDRIRRLPGAPREHAGELGRLAGEVRRPGRAGWWRLPAQVLRMATVANSAREALTPYAPVLAFLSVPFLVSTVLAVVASVVEIALAVIVALALLL